MEILVRVLFAVLQFFVFVISSIREEITHVYCVRLLIFIYYCSNQDLQSAVLRRKIEIKQIHYLTHL